MKNESSFNKKVVVIQKSLTHYRVAFHEKIRKKLIDSNIAYELIYGKAFGDDSFKSDEVEISWAKRINNTVLNLFGIKFIWQPCLKFIKDADLVIVEQANKNLLNYILIIRSRLFNKKFAFWGHGFNHQSNIKSFANKIKRILITTPDWWFAYTSGVARFLKVNNYPGERITVVENSIDMTQNKIYFDSVSANEIESLKNNLNISSNNIGLFCGGIYKEKRIKFLLEACHEIKKSVLDFHLIVIGSGVDSIYVDEAAKKHNWIHYVGPKFDFDRVKYFKASKVFLMPGLVGLAILDSFSFLTPIITTNHDFHSPEIDYLKNNENGIISENSIQQYSKNVIGFLNEKQLQEKIREGCAKSSEEFSIEKMVDNFLGGIKKII